MITIYAITQYLNVKSFQELYDSIELPQREFVWFLIQEMEEHYSFPPNRINMILNMIVNDAEENVTVLLESLGFKGMEIESIISTAVIIIKSIAKYIKETK